MHVLQDHDSLPGGRQALNQGRSPRHASTNVTSARRWNLRALWRLLSIYRLSLPCSGTFPPSGNAWRKFRDPARTFTPPAPIAALWPSVVRPRGRRRVS